jgi:hypothetical protein
MNFLSHDDSEPHLTQQNYEKYLGSGQLLDEENINNLDRPYLTIQSSQGFDIG